MFNIRQLVIKPVVQDIQASCKVMYGSSQNEIGEILSWAGELILGIISNADSLYHNVEHTIMVTLAGQEILKGKHLKEGNVSADDWMHYVLALLCHDIGYLRDICKGDDGETIVIDLDGKTKHIPNKGSCAALTPYHVDRGRVFVKERFANNSRIDADRISNYIEMTRFPAPDKTFYKDTQNLGGLVRAADFIGQLGDPNYLLKFPALFYEFEEIGLNKHFNFSCPDDLRKNYSSFYWDTVRPFIEPALNYLKTTESGRKWVASLHSHVFDSEHSH